jgi:hypothetical protein
MNGVKGLFKGIKLPGIKGQLSDKASSVKGELTKSLSDKALSVKGELTKSLSDEVSKVLPGVNIFKSSSSNSNVSLPDQLSKKGENLAQLQDKLNECLTSIDGQPPNDAPCNTFIEEINKRKTNAINKSSVDATNKRKCDLKNSFVKELLSDQSASAKIALSLGIDAGIVGLIGFVTVIANIGAFFIIKTIFELKEPEDLKKRELWVGQDMNQIENEVASSGEFGMSMLMGDGVEDTKPKDIEKLFDEGDENIGDEKNRVPKVVVLYYWAIQFGLTLVLLSLSAFPLVFRKSFEFSYISKKQAFMPLIIQQIVSLIYVLMALYSDNIDTKYKYITGFAKSKYSKKTILKDDAYKHILTVGYISLPFAIIGTFFPAIQFVGRIGLK